MLILKILSHNYSMKTICNMNARMIFFYLIINGLTKFFFGMLIIVLQLIIDVH